MAYCSVDFYKINVRIGLLNIVIFIDMKDIILKVLREVIEQQELGEKTRTLKNARKVTLYPKSAKKANPLRFRPEIREDRIDYGNNLSPEKLDYIKKIIDSSDRINWSELKYVGIDWAKNHRQIYRLLSKKIGSREDIIKKVDDILLNKIHTIDDCGTYNFNFIVYNYDLEQDTDGVYYINEEKIWIYSIIISIAILNSIYVIFFYPYTLGQQFTQVELRNVFYYLILFYLIITVSLLLYKALFTQKIKKE